MSNVTTIPHNLRAAELVGLETALQPLLDQLAQAGSAARIVACEALKPNVLRVHLTGGAGIPETAIVKRGRPARAAPASVSTAANGPEFLEEAVNYGFLDSLRPTFTRFPRLLAQVDGMLLLEDLGPEPQEPVQPQLLRDCLAGTLARLHAASASADACARYLAMRKRAGLVEDRRIYSFEQYRRLFGIGTRFVLETAHSLGVDPSGCAAFLQEVERVIVSPDGLRVFLHDDLISPRQFVIGGGECRLIDFEMAKYGHPLLELSRSLAGKFDRKAGTNSYILKHLNLPLSLADIYREQLALQAGIIFSQAAWDRALGSAMVYTSIINLGAQFCMSPQHKAYHGFARTQRQVLERLLLLIENNQTCAPLVPVLSALAAHIQTKELD